jgi:hypothetical protein
MKKPDDETKAWLLTFLVVGHLLAAANGCAPPHLIEFAQNWLSPNGPECDWLEPARLIEACRVAALEALDLPLRQTEADLVQRSGVRWWRVGDECP